MEGDYERKPLIQDECFETQPKLSPDGQWIAYMSNESGQMEVCVQSFPEIDEGRWQISRDGWESPVWDPKRHELFYFSMKDNSIMAVTVDTGTTFSAGTPHKLFFISPYSGGNGFPGTPWDIHPIDKRFLMLKPVSPAEQSGAAPAPSKIIFVTNWFEELKERVPVG